ncbi:MAG: hypothetical protein Crog4KO_03500 [Crocinitomicaceae bacterium]
MKKILIPIVCIGLSISAHAEELFKQLVDFNPNWQSYENRVTSQNAIDFTSDKEYIQTHLTHILEILRSNEVSTLTCNQLETRQTLIGVLEAYKNRGLFPMNYYRPERIPVFIDEHNTHCAVGYLLKETGYDHVAKRISEKNNYAWVIEIKDPALPTWQQFSGFTLEELKLIQGAYDYYPPMARTAPNKTEIPQKPDVVILDFKGNDISAPSEENLLSVWCYGEGKDSVLHGRWIQNYRNGTPWIEGYFENGKRTGSWKEYYQGTDILCRTEHWRNDELNGVRTRYDKQGNVIERITFKDGNAVEKVNFDFQGDIKWVRKPIDSMTLATEAYSISGYLLAKGQEQISNSSGRLQWFQDIELTALNTFAITARDGAPQFTDQGAPVYSNQLRGNGTYTLPGTGGFYGGPHVSMFNQEPSLVEYIKIGEWKYYNEYAPASFTSVAVTSGDYLQKDYPHFGAGINFQLEAVNIESLQQSFDSIQVQYEKGRIADFTGYAYDNSPRLGLIIGSSVHRDLMYYMENGSHQSVSIVKGIGPLDENGFRIGEWTMFDNLGQPTQEVRYLQPFKDEEPLTGSIEKEILIGETTR